MDIPDSVMNERLIRRLWHLTNVIISVSLQKAIDVAVETVSSSVAEFDQIADKVLDMHTGDEKLAANLNNFIDGCKFACTANLNWG
ncbi:terpenoid synthase [Penicillium angulare]|uniref:terpenoid synthase n=1 Tax=Penicillium angulare TaxID=116970 RepID=UPI0025401587|nr:terpenoid synthase [Penicillium angulare]KAJ5274029.1 terpenoid synthase [Penicillium angulare]